MVGRGPVCVTPQFGDEAELGLQRVVAREQEHIRLAVAQVPQMLLCGVDVTGAAGAEREAYVGVGLTVLAALLSGAAPDLFV